jgi:hypothetical protein
MRSLARKLTILFPLGLAAACNAITGAEEAQLRVDDAGSDALGGQDTSSGGVDSSAADTNTPADSGADTNVGPTDAADAADGGCPANQILCNGACIPSDKTNCGKCGHDCTVLPHVSGPVTCQGATCVVPASSCVTGYAHCSTSGDDGCEVDITKPANCGSCTTACGTSAPICQAGAGTYTCVTGCSGATPDLCTGTCTNKQTDANNCNACGTVCPAVTHANPTCAAGVCGFACNSGYHTCGAACADNTSINSCGSSCTACTPPANSTATCDGTNCGFTCGTGYHACGAACADNTSINSCGASCTPCTPPANGTATCNGTSCAFNCNAGYHACGTSCADNTSINSCGASCTACTPPANASATCNGTSCAFTCNATYNLCNGACVNYQTDANNCNACGRSCLGGTCVGGVCQPLLYVPASAISNLKDFSTDGTILAWSDNGDNTIDSVSSAGSAKTVVATGVGTNIRGITMSPSGNGSINWLVYDGAASTQPYHGTAGSASSGAMAGGTLNSYTNGAVYNPNGSTYYTILVTATLLQPYSCPSTGQCTAMGASVSASSSSFDIAFGGGYLVWADYTHANLLQTYTASPYTLITSTPPGTFVTLGRVAADGAYAYGRQDNSGPNIMHRSALASTAVSTVGAVGSWGNGFCSDGTYLYYSGNAGNTAGSDVVYMPVAGSTQTTLAAGVNPSSGIKCAGGAVWYAAAGGIYKLRTP